MSGRYAALLQDWRDASARTRRAQRELEAKFDAHIQGAPAPTEEDVALVRELRKIEGAKLEAAIKYVRQTALAPAVGFGADQERK